MYSLKTHSKRLNVNTKRSSRWSKSSKHAEPRRRPRRATVFGVAAKMRAKRVVTKAVVFANPLEDATAALEATAAEQCTAIAALEQ